MEGQRQPNSNMDTPNTTAAIANCPVSTEPTAVSPVMIPDGCSDVAPNKSYDKANIRALVDAAVLASRHAKKCGLQARKAFDAYTVAHETSLEKAAASDAAILEMQEIIESRIAFLSAEQ
jgi:hypothetical protein